MSGIAGQGCPRIVPEEEKKTLEEIERSLVKKYRKPIWSKFIKAIKEYKLVEKGDKIAVAISGGFASYGKVIPRTSKAWTNKI